METTPAASLDKGKEQGKCSVDARGWRPFRPPFCRKRASLGVHCIQIPGKPHKWWYFDPWCVDTNVSTKQPPAVSIASEDVVRALLDTNILIHREASVVVRQEIGLLFNWLDQLGVEKWIHPVSASEIAQHQDERVRRSFVAKLASYRRIEAVAPLAPEVQAISVALDKTDNDRRDSAILNELFVRHVDLLISEDRGIARKAHQLGIGHQVFTIDARNR